MTYLHTICADSPFDLARWHRQEDIAPWARFVALDVETVVPLAPVPADPLNDDVSRFAAPI